MQQLALVAWIAFAEKNNQTALKYMRASADLEETVAALQAAGIDARARMGASDPKQAGRVMGEIMKANKGKFDSSAVRRIVNEELTPK